MRFVAESGGSESSRKAIAQANVTATEQLDTLVGCLRAGSVPSAAAIASFSNITPDQPIRVDSAYCSFFESRLINYEEALFSMVRQAARDDPDAKLLEGMLTGSNVLDFANLLSTLIDIAGRAIRDEMTLRAFTADALELEYFVWQPNVQGPGQLYSTCASPSGAVCNADAVSMPEWASITELRQEMAIENAAGVRPTILVWHFREVQAFMVSACTALNGDEPTVDELDSTRCSAKLPFPGLAAAAHAGGAAPAQRTRVVTPTHTDKQPILGTGTANGGQTSTQLGSFETQCHKARRQIQAMTPNKGLAGVQHLIDVQNQIISDLEKNSPGKTCPPL